MREVRGCSHARLPGLRERVGLGEHRHLFSVADVSADVAGGDEAGEQGLDGIGRRLGRLGPRPRLERRLERGEGHDVRAVLAGGPAQAVEVGCRREGSVEGERAETEEGVFVGALEQGGESVGVFRVEGGKDPRQREESAVLDKEPWGGELSALKVVEREKVEEDLGGEGRPRWRATVVGLEKVAVGLLEGGPGVAAGGDEEGAADEIVEEGGGGREQGRSGAAPVVVVFKALGVVEHLEEHLEETAGGGEAGVAEVGGQEVGGKDVEGGHVDGDARLVGHEQLERALDAVEVAFNKHRLRRGVRAVVFEHNTTELFRNNNHRRQIKRRLNK